MQKIPTNISEIVYRLREKGPLILLESQMRDHPASQKSLLAGNPSASIKTFGDTIIISEKGREKVFKGDPWTELNTFCGQGEWIFGYFGYDLKNSVESLESKNEELIPSPDLFFMRPEVVIEIDKNWDIRILKGEMPTDSSDFIVDPECDVCLSSLMQEPQYLKKVRQAQKDIYEGDYYEVNISHPLTFDFRGDTWSLYNKMRDAGPVPFGGYLTVDEMSVCCSSPERFLSKTGKVVCSQPIKGTAPRAPGDIDGVTINKLRGSEKERAENLMIVDLVRNDLSRIAKKGSVKVQNLFEIQSFETVHQMVSTIECEVMEGYSSVDIIKACFPMGSMTGAPKIASMKAIEKLEDYKRGIYSGAMGYFSPNGDFDFNVVIRSAIIHKNRLVYPVGGAITSDSDPKAEWEETLLKARAITDVFAAEVD